VNPSRGGIDDALNQSDPLARERRADGMIEPPDTPAQWYALFAGVFLVALGGVSLVVEDVGFGTVGALSEQPEFLIWAVSGWSTILWMAAGAAGLVAALRLDTASAYALAAGALFAAVAVWGFIDGNDVLGLIAADTTVNVTHAVLGGLGLLTGVLPRSAQRPREPRQTEAGGEPRLGVEPPRGRGGVHGPAA